MTRANTEQAKLVPWFAKAGAACSIVPIARFIGPNIFALKGGGYGCLFSLTGIDEEGLTDQELESRTRSCLAFRARRSWSTCMGIWPR
jgi:type IV secretion system protein VirB4